MIFSRFEVVMKLFLRILEVVLKYPVPPFTLEVIATLGLVGWQGQLRIKPSFNLGYPTLPVTCQVITAWILNSKYLKRKGNKLGLSCAKLRLA